MLALAGGFTRRTHGRWSGMVLACLVVGLTGCGGGDGDAVTAEVGAGLAGLELSGVAGSAIASSSDVVAVADGSPGRSSDTGLTLYSAEGEATEHSLPETGALVYLRLWWGDEDLHLTAVRCPRWTTKGDWPRFDPDQTGFLADACGEPTLLTSTWSVSESSWSTPVELGPAPSGYFLPSWAGSRALLAVPEDPLATPRDFQIVDVASGQARAIAGGPTEPSVYCLTTNGTVLAAQAAPAADDELPLPEPGTKEPPPLPNLPVWVYDGQSWTEQQAEPSVRAVEGCSSDSGGVVVRGMDNVLAELRVEGGRLISSSLPAEPTDGVTSIESSLNGELLFLQDDDLNSDSVQPEHFWALRGGKWVDLGVSPHATGDWLVALEDQVLTFPRNDDLLQPVVLRLA